MEASGDGEEKDKATMMAEKGSSERWLTDTYTSLYLVQGCHIVLAAIACTAGFVAPVGKAMFVPLLMAYFGTYLLAPILDAMEVRPYNLGTKFYCKGIFLHPSRKRYAGTSRGEALDTCLLARVPHAIAVLTCLIASGIGLSTLLGIITGAFAEFAAKEAVKVSNGEEPMGDKLTAMANDYIDGLEGCCCAEGCSKDDDPATWPNLIRDELGKCFNEDPLCIYANGMVLRRELICTANNNATIGVRMVSTDEPGLQALQINVYSNFLASTSAQVVKGETDYNCVRKKVFGTSEGYTPEEFSAILGAFAQPLNDGILIFLLCLYILLERPAGATIQGEYIVMLQMEAMVKNYVSLKTMLSVVTGILTAVILSACQVPLGAVFGLLACMLNYIPNVGSMIAMVLPVPIIILDDNLSPTQKVMGFVGPASVQGYIGNALEPALFGASLNLTALSVLLGLVFFAAVWGLYGAALSVPLLGAIKIVLHHTDHPLAKACLTLIREDKTIDFDADREMLETVANMKEALDVSSVALEGTEFEYTDDDLVRKKEEYQQKIDDEILYGQR
jgi:predicted PurR-regulated permease PerM